MTQLNLLADVTAAQQTGGAVFFPESLRLSTGQRSHLQELARLLGRPCVALIGFDALGRPVVSRRDARGVATYALHRDGRGVPAAPPVAPLPDDQIENFDPDHYAFLAQFPAQLD